MSDKLNREEQNTYMLIIEAWDNYQFGYASGESRNAFKQIGYVQYMHSYDSKSIIADYTSWNTSMSVV